MKKKNTNLILLIAVFIVGAITAFLMTNSNSKSTISDDKLEYDFSYQDTAAIDKIVLASKNRDTVVLTRVDNRWLVDGEHPARKDAVDVLLETFHGMELRHYVQKSAEQTVLRYMSGYGKSVQVYADGELVQDFIVGTDQNDQLGTYFMKRDGQRPFAIHIPHFNGFLSTRFFIDNIAWRNRDIFGYNDANIKEATMEYSLVPQEGYKITQTEDGKLAVYDNADLPIEPFNAQHTRYLLGVLRTLKYEGHIKESEGAYAKKDSITSSIPVFELTVSTFDGESKTLSAYYMPAEPDTYDNEGNLRLWDPDRFYAYISDGRFVVIQTYAMDNVLKTREYFNR